MNMTTSEGGAQPKEYIAKYAADRVRNASTVYLGATMGCAECHDHKYDPFTTKDFYSFAAFFADVQEQPVALPGPAFAVPNADQEKKLAELDGQIAKVRGVLDTQTPELDAAQAAWEGGRARAIGQSAAIGHLALGRAVSRPRISRTAFDTAFPPEAGVDLAARYNDGALVWAAHDQMARWRSDQPAGPARRNVSLSHDSSRRGPCRWWCRWGATMVCAYGWTAKRPWPAAKQRKVAAIRTRSPWHCIPARTIYS